MIYNCVASPRLCCGAQKSETISQKGCSQTACLVTWAYVVLTLSIRDPISPPYPWPPHTPPHTPFPPPPPLPTGSPAASISCCWSAVIGLTAGGLVLPPRPPAMPPCPPAPPSPHPPPCLVCVAPLVSCQGRVSTDPVCPPILSMVSDIPPPPPFHPYLTLS